MAIVVNLNGGLGNQMFQYAFGRNLAIRNKTDLILDIDNINLPQQGGGFRNFNLHHFNIKAHIAPSGLLDEIRKQTENGKETYKFLYENKHCFDPYKLEQRGNIYAMGLWQSFLYCSEIESLLKEELTLRSPLERENLQIADNIANCNSVSLHIRRGDYLKPHIHNALGICSMDYYKQAVELLGSKINNPNFFIFSDDINWAKQNLNFIKFPLIFVENRNDIRDRSCEDLYLMSFCKHNIIANSTFSAWAAYLNENIDKIITAPQKWFTGTASYIYNVDTIPEGWFRI